MITTTKSIAIPYARTQCERQISFFQTSTMAFKHWRRPVAFCTGENEWLTHVCRYTDYDDVDDHTYHNINDIVTGCQ